MNRVLRSLGFMLSVGTCLASAAAGGTASPPVLQSPNRFDRIGPAEIIVIAEPNESTTLSGATIYA